MTDEEQRARLIGFSRDGGRSPPPVFVGRDGAISDILLAADRVYERWIESSRKPQRHAMTRLVQGAPGAGKSTLIERIQELAAQGAAPSGTQHLAFFLSASELSRPGDLTERISTQIPGGVLATAASAVVKLATSLLIGSSRPASGAADKAEQAVRKVGEKHFPGTLLLMIDEAQQVAPNSAEANALRTLHQALHSLPILPVFAGLGHLEEHLAQEGIGISRFAGPECVHTIGALSPEEGDDLLEGWLEHFEIDAEPCELAKWQGAMRRDAQGWAMHTYDFLDALSLALADSPCPRQLSAPDMEAVRQAAAAKRNNHYGKRYGGGALSDNPDGVARLMAHLRKTGPQPKPDIKSAICRTFSAPGNKGQDAWLNALLMPGFLQAFPESDGFDLPSYACPIPSLASYAAMAGHRLHRQASAGNVVAMRAEMRKDPSAIGRTDAMGRTALHVAAEGRWGTAVDALIKAGADPRAKDAMGETPAKTWPEHGWPHGRARDRLSEPPH